MINGMQRYLAEEELEHYRDGWISRREFLRRATLIGVAAAAAAEMARSVVPAQPVSAAPPAQASPFSVPEDDPAVATDWIWYRSTDGTLIKAYVAWPAGASMDQSRPGVVVCHENRGLLAHHRDVPRRFAKQGYVALAPDLISRTGTPTDAMTDDEGRAAFASLNVDRSAADLLAAIDVLKAHPAVDDSKLAATGYCAGSSVIWRVVVRSRDLKAAAPFYGGNPPLDEVPNIRAAVFAVYGALDERINAGIPAIEAAMMAAGVKYGLRVYPDSAHAFHNDTGASYNPETAPQAWRDTLEWFAENLGLMM
jgi:carboxymethylenebutenolidase